MVIKGKTTSGSAGTGSYTALSDAVAEELTAIIVRLALGEVLTPAVKKQLRAGHGMTDDYIQSAASILRRQSAKLGLDGVDSDAMVEALRRDHALVVVSDTLETLRVRVEGDRYRARGAAGLEARAVEDALQARVKRLADSELAADLKVLQDERRKAQPSKRKPKPKSEPTK